jgi:hypothetical protein
MAHKVEALAYKIAERLGSPLIPDAGGNFMCACPAHDDETPSFAIRDTATGILTHCFAGCTHASIIAALQKRGLLPDGVTIAADDINGAKIEAESDIKVDGAASEPEAPDASDGGDETDEAEEAAEDPAEAATKARAEEKAKKLAAGRAKFSVVWQAIDANRRPEFMGAVTTKLEAAGPAAIGPGALHRTARTVQRDFWDPPPDLRSGRIGSRG